MTGDVTLGHLVTMVPARFLHNKVTVPPPQKKRKKEKEPYKFFENRYPHIQIHYFSQCDYYFPVLRKRCAVHAPVSQIPCS